MKRVAIALLAGIAAVAGLGYSASAADLRVAPAPAPAPVQSWTGIYVGMHGGAAWQSTPAWSFNDPNGVIAPTSLNNTAGNSALGGVGGFQAGYNWQFAPAWVVGVEGDFSWASLADHRTQQPLVFGGALTPNTSVQMSANTQWLASARAKFGYVGLWNTMFYGTGGVAWANIEYAAQEANEPPNFATDFRSVTSFHTTKSGWVIGGGAEWMATTNILLRAEYLYYAFNSGTNASANLFPNPGAFPVAFNYNWASYNVQVFRVAGSYKF